MNATLHQLDLLALHEGLSISLTDIVVKLEHLVSLFVEFVFSTAQLCVEFLAFFLSQALLSLFILNLRGKLVNLYLKLLLDRVDLVRLEVKLNASLVEICHQANILRLFAL